MLSFWKLLVRLEAYFNTYDVGLFILGGLSKSTGASFGKISNLSYNAFTPVLRSYSSLKLQFNAYKAFKTYGSKFWEALGLPEPVLPL